MLAWILVLSLVLGTVGVVGVLGGRTEVWEVVCAVIGPVGLLVWFVLVTSENPLLVVDARGIRAPLWHQHEVLGWGRIARVRRGATWGQNALDVYVWKDIDDKTAAGGVEHVLHIPAGLLPVPIKKLVPEIESYRPATGPDPTPTIG